VRRLCAFLCFVAIALGATLSTPARSGEFDYLTVGLRVAALIAQSRIASPPLPELGRDKKHHFTPQVAYLTGRIFGDFGKSQGVITDASYTGEPEGWGYGLAYQSPTVGRLSLFAYGLYTHSSSNYAVTFNSPNSPDLKIDNSRTQAKAMGTGLSLLVVGDTDSFFAAGAFGGGFYSDVNTKYDYVYASPPLPGYDTTYFHNWTSKDHGITTGLQAKIRVKKFSITALAVYTRDLSGQCIPEADAAGNYYPCNASIDNSFTAYSVSVGYRGLSVGLFSRLNSEIEASDVKLRKLQASYTLSL